MKLSIITDGNNVLGLGHVYQSLTLARLLASHGEEVSFLTKSEDKICDFLRNGGFPVQRFANDDQIFAHLSAQLPHRVIFDKLDVSPLLAEQIRTKLKIKLIIFTNLTEANRFADMTVLADIGSNFKNISQRDPVSGRVEFYGPKYWLLRPEFYELKKKPKSASTEIKKIMLMFGGADPSNFSSTVLDKILNFGQTFELLLVLGGSYAHRKELDEILIKHKSTSSKVTVVENLKTVAEAMYASDVVFASPGLSFFEALAVGSPVVGFHQDELQRSVYEEVLPTFGKGDLEQVPAILTERTFIYPHRSPILEMEIGEGKDDLIQEILR